VWGKSITAYTAKSAWENKGNMIGHINKASDNAKDVVSDADIILVCCPAQNKPQVLKQIKPYLKDGALIGTIFGQGAFDVQCMDVLERDIESKHLTIFTL